MGQLAGDPVVGELALPLQGFAVRNQSRFDDFEWLHAVPLPVPCPSSPVPLPRIAQLVPKMPNAMLIATHTIIPAMPKKRSKGAARKPTRIAPIAASTAITPRCQMLSRAKLRYHPNAPPTPTAAMSPASRGSAALAL